MLSLTPEGALSRASIIFRASVSQLQEGSVKALYTLQLCGSRMKTREQRSVLLFAPTCKKCKAASLRGRRIQVSWRPQQRATSEFCTALGPLLQPYHGVDLNLAKNGDFLAKCSQFLTQQPWPGL